MKKAHRNGIGISSAFRGAAKRLGNQGNQAVGYSIFNVGQNFKNGVRSIVKFFFRLMKPLFQKILFKLRRYMLQDILLELQNISTSISRQAQVIKLQSERIEQLSAVGPVSSLAEFHGTSGRTQLVVNCNHNDIVFRTEAGFIFALEKDRNQITEILDTVKTKPGIYLLLQKILKPDDVFLCINSNYGIDVLAASRSIGPNGKIVAIERSDKARQSLDKTFWLNNISNIASVLLCNDSNEFAKLCQNKEDAFCVKKANLIKIGVADNDGVEFINDISKINDYFSVIVEVQSEFFHVNDRKIYLNKCIDIFSGCGMSCFAIHHITGDFEKILPAQLEGASYAGLFFTR